MPTDNKTALLIGGSGLVGGHLLEYLLADPDYSHIKSLVRSKSNISHKKLEFIQVDFEHLRNEAPDLTSDHVFCCLGTTIAKAGSQENFRKVDYEYPLIVAEMAFQQGAQTYSLVSALGANPESRIFYNRVKGEIEVALATLGYPGLLIFRPSLLLGDRKEQRLGEGIGKMLMGVLNPLMVGSLRRYRGIEAKAVAYAMWQQSKSHAAGLQHFESEEIQKIFENSSSR